MAERGRLTQRTFAAALGQSRAHFMSTAEVAARFGVTRQRVGQIRQTDLSFPRPQIEIDGGPMRVLPKPALEPVNGSIEVLSMPPPEVANWPDRPRRA